MVRGRQAIIKTTRKGGEGTLNEHKKADPVFKGNSGFSVLNISPRLKHIQVSLKFPYVVFTVQNRGDKE